jgi:hypothetical protein
LKDTIKRKKMFDKIIILTMCLIAAMGSIVTILFHSSHFSKEVPLWERLLSGVGAAFSLLIVMTFAVMSLVNWGILK